MLGDFDVIVALSRRVLLVVHAVDVGDGLVISWGRNDSGQLGLGHMKQKTQPDVIDPAFFNNEPVTDIAAGCHHSLAITGTNPLSRILLWCWLSVPVVCVVHCMCECGCEFARVYVCMCLLRVVGG